MKKTAPPTGFTAAQIAAARKLGGTRILDGPAPTKAAAQLKVDSAGNKTPRKPKMAKAPKAAKGASATATIKVTATAGGKTKKKVTRVRKSAAVKPSDTAPVQEPAGGSTAEKTQADAEAKIATDNAAAKNNTVTPKASWWERADKWFRNMFTGTDWVKWVILALLMIGAIVGLIYINWADGGHADKKDSKTIVRDIGGSSINAPIKPVVTNTVAVVNSTTTNVPTKSAATVKSELPEINGIKGNNNKNNTVIMIGSVEIGSRNGMLPSEINSAVSDTISADIPNATKVAGGLPAGCTKITRIEVPQSELTTSRTIQLPTIEMVPGEYVQAMVPPNGWSLTFSCPSLGVNIREDGKPYTRGAYNPHKQNIQVSEFGFYLEPGTTSAKLNLTISR